VSHRKHIHDVHLMMLQTSAQLQQLAEPALESAPEQDTTNTAYTALTIKVLNNTATTHIIQLSTNEIRNVHLQGKVISTY